jgi:hypothetical protein
MKKSICIAAALSLLSLLYCSCLDEPASVQSNPTIDQRGTDPTMEKPPSNTQLTCMLKVIKPDGSRPDWPVELPSSLAPLWIHYEVSGPNPITKATIHIVYDENKDAIWSVFVSERMRVIQLLFDGTQRTVRGDIPWNGEVDTMMSDDGYVFDQYMTDNPDLYLFPFTASDGRSSVNNWGGTVEAGPVPDEARAYITPLHTKAEFAATNIVIVPTRHKGKYVADLNVDVACALLDGSPAIGFFGRGKWVQVYPGGVEGVPQTYSCCLEATFFDDYELGTGDGVGTASGLSVGQGTYRFYVTLMWSRNKSYRPSVPAMYGEVTVP